jgi:competence protein ComEA
MFLKRIALAATFSTLTTLAALAQATAPATPARPATPTAPPAAAAPAVTAPRPATAPTQAVVPAAKKVNLNTADAKELDSLPQIGEARAKAIIEARTKAKFKDWADFQKRDVVPKNTEEAIKDKVSF